MLEAKKGGGGKGAPFVPVSFIPAGTTPPPPISAFPVEKRDQESNPPTAPLLYIQGQWRWRQQQMEVERRLSVSQKRKERKKGRKFCFIFENSPSSSLLLFQTEFLIYFFFILGKRVCVCVALFYVLSLGFVAVLHYLPAFSAAGVLRSCVYTRGRRGRKGGEAKSALLSRIARSYSFFSSLFVREYVQRSGGGY